MSVLENHHLFHRPIADHAFAPASSTKDVVVAVDNAVNVYSRSNNKLELVETLKGHDKIVTGVDIAPTSGLIVTCSQDRNVYVWERSASGYKPTLVLSRLNRAATTVRWSPSEDKFAVGSSARLISVCYYEAEGNWWVSRHLKKPFKSTVTALAWHPNSVLLAAGSTDGHARVVSGFVKLVDKKPEPTAWGSTLPFNTICLDHMNNTGGWVQDIAFSPDGGAVAYVGHDSTLNVVYPAGPGEPPRAALTILTTSLPFTSLLWSSESQIIAAGYDCEIYSFVGSEAGWQLDKSFQKQLKKAAPREEEQTTSALQMFRDMDLKGRSESSSEAASKTVHQNAILKIKPAGWGSDGSVTSFSTSGSDGRIVFWSTN